MSHIELINMEVINETGPTVCSPIIWEDLKVEPYADAALSAQLF